MNNHTDDVVDENNTNSMNNNKNNHKYIFGVLAIGLVVAVLVLGYFQFVANSSDEDEATTNNNQEQEAENTEIGDVATDELGSYLQWCSATVPGALQDIVIGAVSGTKTLEQAEGEVNSLFSSVTPPEDIVLLHNARAELFVLILPGYITAEERTGDDGESDFVTVILGGLDADQQARAREVNEEARSAYDALPDATKTAAQEAECSLFEDIFSLTTS